MLLFNLNVFPFIFFLCFKFVERLHLWAAANICILNTYTSQPWPNVVQLLINTELYE